MLSIFVMYSTDRLDALKYTISCLENMDLYDQCQKTLITDGKTNVVPVDWDVIQVKRLFGKFCWSSMWEAGVVSAINEKILYLDSDRLLPKSFLRQMCESIKDNVFVFTSRHFMMQNHVALDVVEELLHSLSIDGKKLLDDKVIGKIKYEPRFRQPIYGPGKNVMSGCTGFTKSTYWRLGGVDPWYCGHGAYADTDFHLAASEGGCEFLDLEVPELHYFHEKRENQKVLDSKSLEILGLDNFIYFCKKWQVSLVLAEQLAMRIGVSKPANYVEKKAKEFSKVFA